MLTIYQLITKTWDFGLDLFRSFAGQARKRWSQSICTPIVTKMERGVVAAGGRGPRGWLEDIDKARDIMLGTADDSNPDEKSSGA